MKKYSETHEWVELEGDIASIGISNHAQTLLGDIAFVELPAIGTEVKQGEPLGVIESVKSASDFYAPISGTVVAVNESIAAHPAELNGQANTYWLVKIKSNDSNEWDALMQELVYNELL
jgi:glycine cleavage system H protein